MDNSKGKNATEFLEKAGLAPTPNRILVVRELLAASAPLSLSELELRLDTLDKSSIFRVLNRLSDIGLVHAFEDGRGIAKFEICHCADHREDDDRHVHFYCTECRHTFCLSEVRIPEVNVPQDFDVTGVNFMLKGLCPNCKKLTS